MIIRDGQIYLDEGHVKELQREPGYVQKRYFAIVRTEVPTPFGITRRQAASQAGLSLRQFYRVLKRYRTYGINGLTFRSRRPKTSPNKTPDVIEEKIVKVRKASGFGPGPISDLVNESFRREGTNVRVHPSLTYNVLVRAGEIERERRVREEYQRFEWGHPDRLIQADLTKFNGLPILTMSDDHARKGWAMILEDENEDTVITGMKALVPHPYDNLLTDNGSQFSRRNSKIRKYCDRYVRERHIWTSVHHPQTMGKLSAFQKALKRFLIYKVGRSRCKRTIKHWINVYLDWYNHGRTHHGIGTVPEARYSGKPDLRWYERLVKALKLEGVLSVTCATG